MACKSEIIFDSAGWERSVPNAKEKLKAFTSPFVSQRQLTRSMPVKKPATRSIF